MYSRLYGYVSLHCARPSAITGAGGIAAFLAACGSSGSSADTGAAGASGAAGRTWSFTLRKGVLFSDGTPLDAPTVKASFDRLLDPANKSAALSAFASVLKAGGVAVSGADTVVFHLERPFSDFPYLVSAGNYNAVVLKSDYKVGTFATKAIGTGPFRLDSYDVGQGASLRRNPKYRDAGKPYLDGVKVTFHKDAQADLLALQSGAIDAQILSEADLVVPIAGSNSIAVDKASGTSLTAFTLRVDRPPFTKKEVRQAISYALDRPGVLTAVYNGVGVIGNDHLLAPAFAAAPKDLAQRAKDAAKVRSLLSAAGSRICGSPSASTPRTRPTRWSSRTSSSRWGSPSISTSRPPTCSTAAIRRPTPPGCSPPRTSSAGWAARRRASSSSRW
ncbi:hypothetical protein ThrDRAFT_00667 [Frankia casuarinae]|nr:hypothetical protein CcI6DRAFT_00883 [Frankia sp. CcI6]EYT93605.1 hypothetical protein ThrDRAFT_00667 [Frankia casuarinae]KDA43825.1 hypothetical protein BMG523Draft_01207 [Frankia sp. BMG5.23]